MAAMSPTLGRLGILATLGLAACAAPRATEAPVAAASPALAVATPRFESVIGSTASALVARFGEAALDVREGPARKLQFSGRDCILDAYLYPPRANVEPVVTHADARQPNGSEMDRDSCVAALNGREPPE